MGVLPRTTLPKDARLAGMLCDPRLRKAALLALMDLAGNGFTLLCTYATLSGARKRGMFWFRDNRALAAD